MRLKSLTDYILSRTRGKGLFVKVAKIKIWEYFVLNVNTTHWREKSDPNIIRKNQTQTYLVGISANVTGRKATAVRPLDKGTTGLSQKQGKRHQK